MKMIDIGHGITEQFNLPKFKLPMIAAAVLLPFMDFFKEFIFNDWKFLVFLVVLMSVDTVTGVAKAWKRGQISSQGFTGILIKGFVYAAFVIVLHGLESFSDKEAIQITFDWVGSLGYAAVMVRESISIIENIGAIKEGVIPSWILAKLKDFDEDGKVDG